METRVLTQVKIYILVMNPMMGHTENRSAVAMSFEKEKLHQWYQDQICDPWTDEGENSFEPTGDMGGYYNEHHIWRKYFRRGSPLEWFNPIFDENLSIYGHGVDHCWVNEDMLEEFKRQNHSIFFLD